ncbi:MAG: N-acetyl-gamma-glutamyl-phosphate reductase [Thermodesulfobacteriota bacterium]
MVRVAVVGGSGYTGVELLRILSRHPEAEITTVTSRQYAGKKVGSVFPSLRSVCELSFTDVDAEALAPRADVVFTAVPHQTAMGIVPTLLAGGCKVVDLSADFRIGDAAVYEQWYQPHSAAALLAEAVYGLPEIHRAAIAGARLIANPGCYPTSAILGLAPLLREKLIDPASIVIDSKSGTSGAGRAAQVGSLYCEVADGFKAYKVGEHRHTPEIEQELGRLAGCPCIVSFTPHLVPMSRGILTTAYAGMVRTDIDLHRLYAEFYGDEPFVRVLEKGSFPATQFVRGSNFCDIGCKYDPRTGRVVIVAAIDNLVKGAAGQAVQNMNVLCGLPESLGLDVVPFFP